MRNDADMNSRQLAYFLAACEELNFTRAAKRCGVSQPSLSNALRTLEAELGGRLFYRRPSPRLSELGRSVQPHLRRALAEIELALAAAGSAAERSGKRDAPAPDRHFRPLVEELRNAPESRA
jgi:DNA-binding transcriptional LysR family regulator